MNKAITRRAAALGLAVAVSLGALSATTPANAHGTEWHYYGSYFWGSDCTRVGNQHVDMGMWTAYKCVGGWFEDYKLYYRHY